MSFLYVNISIISNENMLFSITRGVITASLQNVVDSHNSAEGMLSV